MKRNVGILIFDEVEVLDFAGPFEIFAVTSQISSDEPFNVFTVAPQAGPVTAVNGLKVLPDYSIHDHPPIDILILSGGDGTKKLMHDVKVLHWISLIHGKTQLTLSICSASRLIGTLGLLDDRPYCTHHDVYDHMLKIAPSASPRSDKRFTQTDDRLYTSGGIAAGMDLSLHIIGKLLGEATAVKTADYMEYPYKAFITHGKVF